MKIKTLKWTKKPSIVIAERAQLIYFKNIDTNNRNASRIRNNMVNLF